jgi:hypothetical protein
LRAFLHPLGLFISHGHGHGHGGRFLNGWGCLTISGGRGCFFILNGCSGQG